MLSPEQLRAAALDLLGPHADQRARDALVRSVLGVEPGVAGWEGSGGVVRAHRVLLGLSPRGLAEFERVPNVGDAVCAALAAAVSAHPGEAMAELRAYWALADEGLEAGYRAAPTREARPDDPVAVRDAVVAYLRSSGEPEAAAHAARARVALAAGRVTLAFAREDWHGLRLDPAWSARIEHAARALLAGTSGAAVRVTLRPA